MIIPNSKSMKIKVNISNGFNNAPDFIQKK